MNENIQRLSQINTALQMFDNVPTATGGYTPTLVITGQAKTDLIAELLTLAAVVATTANENTQKVNALMQSIQMKVGGMGMPGGVAGTLIIPAAERGVLIEHLVDALKLEF